MSHAGWAVTDFYDSFVACLREKQAEELRLYFYGVTNAGWNEVERDLRRWKNRTGKEAVAYIGTDHGLTDPDALQSMIDANISLRVMRHYDGVFHPKVIWFKARRNHTILVGSNNLTRDGLTHNIEFATISQLSSVNDGMKQWHKRVHHASELITTAQLQHYRQERERYQQDAARAGFGGVYTWTGKEGAVPLPNETPPSRKKKKVAKKKAVRSRPVRPVFRSGDLILEVTRRETSEGGRQVQIPSAAARDFFGLQLVTGRRVNFSLRNAMTNRRRDVSMRRNGNATQRISFSELEYSSRPCVILFRRTANANFQYYLYRESIFPRQYRELIAQCTQNFTQRRWAIVE
jgi:hypothetical protein